VSHLATRLGLEDDKAFIAAYWKVFESFFGAQNAPMIKATLLARVAKGDTGSSDLDRVCLGLRETMGWAAEAIEKKALDQVGRSYTAEAPHASEKRATT
jgi:hypothetical protein